MSVGLSLKERLDWYLCCLLVKRTYYWKIAKESLDCFRMLLAALHYHLQLLTVSPVYRSLMVWERRLMRTLLRFGGTGGGSTSLCWTEQLVKQLLARRRRLHCWSLPLEVFAEDLQGRSSSTSREGELSLVIT